MHVHARTSESIKAMKLISLGLGVILAVLIVVM